MFPRFWIIIFAAVVVPIADAFDLKCMQGDREGQCICGFVNISSPKATITTVNGVTTPTSFQELIISFGKINFLPKGLGKFFSQVTQLHIDSDLKSISAADLEGLTNLKALYLGGNGIEELRSDLFKFTPKLTDIDFSKNEISRVGKDLIKDLHSLENIDFTCNKCIDRGTTLDFETVKDELRIKCADPKEVEEENCSEVLGKYENDIKELEKERQRYRLTRFCSKYGPNWSDLIRKRSTKLEECRKAKTVKETH